MHRFGIQTVVTDPGLVSGRYFRLVELLAAAGMRRDSQQAAGDSFLGMAPCGPLYSRGKSLRRPASISGNATNNEI